MIWTKRLTVVTLLAVAIYVGLEAWTQMQPAPPDHSDELLAILRATRAKGAAIEHARDSLRTLANRSGEKTDANPDGAFTIVLDAHIPAPSVTPSADRDTTTFVIVIRETDKRQFLAPLFLVKAYRTEHTLRLYQDSTVIPYKDTLIKQTWDYAQEVKSERDKSRKETRFWKAATVGLSVVGLVVLVFK